MLFRRQKPAGWREKLWPKKGWSRSVKYIVKRLIRLSGSPYAIAMGAAAGVMISFTPFLGLHFILGAIIAFLLRGSMVASALGTFAGNPLTFPFIWIMSYNLGTFILGAGDGMDQGALLDTISRFATDLGKTPWGEKLDLLYPLWPTLLKPMTVGGIPLGIIAGTVSYFMIKKIADSYHESRANRLMQL